MTMNPRRHTLLWNVTLGLPLPLTAAVPLEWQQAIETLIAEGRARAVEPGPRLVATPHPEAEKFTPEAAASINAWCRLILVALEAEGTVAARSWAARGARYGLNPDHFLPARRWLRDDGLAATRDGVTRPVHPAPERSRLLTAEDVGLVPVAAPEPVAPEPVRERARLTHTAPVVPEPVEPEPVVVEPVSPVASTPAPAPEPEPVVVEPSAPAPEPEPVVVEPEPVTPAKRRPKPATPTALTLEAEYLARIAAATELHARLAAARTAPSAPSPAIGVSPLLDAQRRIAVVLAAADDPLTASELAAKHLTPAQRVVRDAALSDGVAQGAFVAVGGILGRGARYVLRDPAPLGLDWDAITTAVATIHAGRAARRAG